MKEENEWYAEILGLHEQHSDYTFASGKIIAVDPSNKYGNFTINAGTNNDVALGDPVVTDDGLVGVVSEVSLTSAKVKTILDPSIKVSAAITRSGDTGSTGGSVSLAQEGKLSLNMLDRESGAAIGDIVSTSGLGGIYPDGLLIGRITQITPESDGLTLSATIEPFVDVHAIKRVMVITSFDAQGVSE